jgi:hypothetical protein
LIALLIRLSDCNANVQRLIQVCGTIFLLHMCSHMDVEVNLYLKLHNLVDQDAYHCMASDDIEDIYQILMLELNCTV